MGARGKLFLLSVLLVLVNFKDIRAEGTQCPESNEGLAVHLPHETNCSLFYHCDWGVPVLKECPDGLHFNQILEVCDWPERAGCQGGGSGGSDDSSDDTGSDGEGNSAANEDGSSDGNGGSTGGNDGEGSNADNSSNGGSECPADNEGNAVHLPHESDCGLFYQCDWGVAVLKECPAGLHFNPILQVCDWPDDAGCQSGGDDNGNDGDNDGNDGEGNSDGDGEGDNDDTNNGDNDGGEGDGDSDNSGDSNGGSECPADNEGNAVHLPHESDCSLFYQCDWGVAVLKECPAGLHFNPVLQVCNWPDDASCQSGGDDNGNDSDNGGNDGEGNSDGEDDNDGTNNGGNDGGEGDGDSDNSGDSNGGSECPADNEGNAVHLPHESDCGLFYQCDWGVAVLKECPAGLHFNPVLQVCDWPDDAGCQTGGGSVGDEGSDDVEVDNNGDGDNSGDNSDGGDNSDNDGNSSSEAPSTQDGSGFCNTVSCPAENEEYVTFIPNTQDCTRFCKCNWGLAYEFVCPAGLFFNPTLNVCDYPERAGCNSP